MRSILTTRDLARGLALAALALLAGPLACSQPLRAPIAGAHGDEAPPARGGTLHIASYTDMRNLDPAGPSDGFAQQAAHHLFAGLVEYDRSGKLVPDLADHWDVGDDGRTYRFVLRPGVRMHDGEELTAEDVKRSVERALHPSAPNPLATYFEGISGYQAFTSNKAPHLDGVVVEGRYTVSFHLKERDAAFLPLLSMTVLRPVCKSGGDRYVDTWLPCGAGPFRLEPGGWNRGTSLRIVRHEGYFRPGLPYLDAIEWTFNQPLLSQRFRFEDGDLDMLYSPSQADAMRFNADPRWKPFGVVQADTIVWGEAMNTQMPPFDNVEVRRAVAAAIDRAQYPLVRPANMSTMTQLLPRNVPGYDPSLAGQHHDYAAALEHMLRAGYPYDPETGKGGWPDPIVYVVTDYAVSMLTAQILQQQLAKIGLRLELHLVSWPAYLAITQRRGASAMHAQGWTMDYLDPSTFFEPLFASSSIGAESSNNTAFYSNPRYDEIISHARRELDTSLRNALYRQANEILCDEAPWAFTYGQHDFIVRHPYVRGFAAHPVEPLALREVWLDRAAGALEHVLGGGLR
jgi:ABC-type transport system substrate-binding protein